MLKNRHIQTIWAQKFRRIDPPAFIKKRLELDDGDFLDLAWRPGIKNRTVLIVHGLGGSIDSTYARGLMARLSRKGWQVVLMHSRGCSGEANRTPISYHGGHYHDIIQTVEYINNITPGSRLDVIGISLGGSALINALGQLPTSQLPIRSAVAVSVPYDLSNAAEQLNKGLSKIYQTYLLRNQKWLMRAKKDIICEHVDYNLLTKSNTFRSFDHNFTAPLHGFSGADEYYARCSARQYLPGINIPTLLIHAVDDPFMTPASIPDQSELSSSTLLECRPHGGHVGFIDGPPWAPVNWMEERIIRWLKNGH